MTPERQQELRELCALFEHPASSTIGQAADYIEILERRNRDLKEQLENTKHRSAND